jgi:lambda family phage minor tail protein L
MTYQDDVQKLEPGDEVILYELDATAILGDVARFYPGNPGIHPVIYWQGNEFSPWPINVTEIGMTGDAQQPAPTLTAGDIDGSITALCAAYADLVGAKLVRYRTFGHYLDAANFTGGNATADPTQGRVDSFLIERKSNQVPGETVEFELSSPLDFGTLQFPGRQIIQNVCSWLAIGGYRGPYCGYTGSAYFDKSDNAVADPSLDRCGGYLTSCKARFGASNPLPFGSFPAATLIQT